MLEAINPNLNSSLEKQKEVALAKLLLPILFSLIFHLAKAQNSNFTIDQESFNNYEGFSYDTSKTEAENIARYKNKVLAYYHSLDHDSKDEGEWRPSAEDFKLIERIHEDSLASFVIGARTFMQKIIGSKEYNSRLKNEGFSNPDSVQNERLRPLNKPIVLDFSEMGWDPGYDTISKNITFDIRGFINSHEVLVHEYGHGINDAEKGLSVTAKILYQTGFSREGLLQLNQEGDKLGLEYISNPSELDARRYMLIQDLEQLGIWKYGQPFNEKIYEEMLSADKNLKLSRNSHQFLKVIDKKILIIIMNTLA